jgi:hypothetical protein
MRKYLFISLIIILVSSCNLTDYDGGNEITVDMIDPENPPVMVFESKSHDFGNVAMGEKLTHSFKFTNEGESPLLIHSVQPSCHCTVMKDWPHDPVPPGESGLITAQFEGKFAGSNSKSIAIMANTEISLTRLTLTATVVGAE